MDKLHEAPLVISGQWQWLILCRLMHSRDAIESSLTFMSIGIHASERGAHLKRVNYDSTASVLSSRLLPETCSLLFPLWPSPERWSDTPRISRQGRRSQNLRTQIFAVLMGGTGARYWRGCVLFPIQELRPSFSPLQSQATVKCGAHAAVFAVLNSPLMEKADCPQAIILGGACILQVHWEPRVLASESGKWVDGKCPGRRTGLSTRKECQFLFTVTE